MSTNAELKYRTVDTLRADVEADFKNYTLENLIEPQDIIRTAKWCTADLGLKIYKTKSTVLELHHGRVKLPDDFYVFNYGLLCGEGVIRVPLPQGLDMREIPYPAPLYKESPGTGYPCAVACPTVDISTCGGCGSCARCNAIVDIPGFNPLVPYGDPCVKPRVFLDCKNNAFELIQVIKTEARHWKIMLPLKLINSNNQISACCPNLYVNCPEHIWIKDNFLYSNLKCGNVFINYEGMMEDEEGTLLVPDQELLNPFYEYKAKVRILENLFVNGEQVENQLKYFKIELRTARIEAQSVVNMPELSDLERAWKINRKAYNARFVDMFKSCNWLGSYGGRIW